MILFIDLDHTICDAAWRDSLIFGAQTDWNNYHTLSIRDKPIPEMVAMVRSLDSAGWKVIAVTARPEKFRQLTNKWLMQHTIPIDTILMRPDEAYRPAPEIKLALIAECLGKANVSDIPVLVIDDREDVAAALSVRGFTVLQVHRRAHNPMTDKEGL